MLLITVFFVIFTTTSSDSIYSIVKGNVNNSWKFDFSLYVVNLDGVLMYVVKSNEHQFGISVAKESGQKYICIRYRHSSVDRFQGIPLRQLCGFVDGANRSMEFSFESKGGIVTLTCNGRKPQCGTLKTTSTSNGQDHLCSRQNGWDVYFSIAKSMVTQMNKFMVWMANIGPYIADDDTTYSTAEQQLHGCLISFLYNSREISSTFTQGSAFKNRCTKCYPNICNGGLCVWETIHQLKCDCSSTAFRGHLCTEGPRKYRKEENHSYKPLHVGKEINIKLLWLPNNTDNYCLLEMLGVNSRGLLRINNNRLIINDVIVDSVDPYVTSLCVIRITKHSVFINLTTGNNKIGSIEVVLNASNTLQFNVGFSEILGQCNAFDGALEFQYSPKEINRSKWRRFENNKGNRINVTDIPTSTYNSSTFNINVLQSNIIYSPVSIYLPPLLLILMMAMAITILAVVLRKIAMKKSTTTKENFYELEYADRMQLSDADATYDHIDYSTV